MTILVARPRQRKTTLRFSAETRAIADKLPQRTLNKSIQSLLLIVGRQQRHIDGLGPRELREFCALLGIESDLPPEYRYTARERELHRVERAKLVGARQLDQADVIELDQADVVELDQADVIELDQADVVELDQADVKKTVCQRQNIQKTVLTYKACPAHPQELEARGERVRQLALALAVLSASSLARVQSEATPERPTSELERELETLLAIYSPSPSAPTKRHMWRDLS